MRLILVSVLSLWASSASAFDGEPLRGLSRSEVCGPGPRSEGERRMCHLLRYRGAHRRKTVGKVLTVSGLAAIGLGAGLAAVTVAGCGSRDCGSYGLLPAAIGGSAAVLGSPLVAVGVPVWIHGRKQELRLRPFVYANLGEGGRVGLQVAF